ncbi:S1C family serine protease [Desnuesiella massiliensis]|uniref:S1C family serine protease n=1 Tax=Desnuesiella massiliensis TaxID=1650662 RepID=UPI0006E335F9|nr:trypsin-like peptidase domain-containing protein [Desnuesiella massiliensis]
MDNMNFNNENRNIQEPDFVIVNDNKNSGAYGYKENHSPYREHGPKGKKSSGKRALSYVAIGLICATLGGAAGAAGTLYVLPKTEAFKESPLYKSMSNNKNVSYGPTTIASEKDALTVSEIVKKVGPAVVGVSTKSKVSSGFFNQQVQEGIGSGFIINEEGYILTNFHVISGAQEVKVILSDGKEVAAKVINYDQDNDVAVVKITDNIKVPGVAELGDSESVQVGEGVVAIGNPLGKEFLGTVTNGIVSALNRDIDIQNKKLNLIQTNAAINPGNSGGPLVNSRGQVIGINTAKIGAEGVEGIGFSIPINQIKGRLESLSKPILKVGISAREITEEMAKTNKVPVGVYILEVQEFSPAEKAGIRPGDIVTKFDGEKVKTVGEINQIKGKHKSGDTVKVEIVRDGKTKVLDLTLSE